MVWHRKSTLQIRKKERTVYKFLRVRDGKDKVWELGFLGRVVFPIYLTWLLFSLIEKVENNLIYSYDLWYNVFTTDRCRFN